MEADSRQKRVAREFAAWHKANFQASPRQKEMKLNAISDLAFQKEQEHLDEPSGKSGLDREPRSGRTHAT